MVILLCQNLGIILSLVSKGSIKLLLSQLYYKPDSLSGYESGLVRVRGPGEKEGISFYTLGLTFLIFDLELLLIFPFLFSITFATKYTFLSACIFLILLGLDFFYELYNDLLGSQVIVKTNRLVPTLAISYSILIKLTSQDYSLR